MARRHARAKRSWTRGRQGGAPLTLFECDVALNRLLYVFEPGKVVEKEHTSGECAGTQLARTS